MSVRVGALPETPGPGDGLHPLARTALLGLGLPPPAHRDSILSTATADHISNFNPYGGAYAQYPTAVPIDLQERYAAFLRDETAAAGCPIAVQELGERNVLLTEGSVSGLDLLVRAFGEPHKEHVVITPPTFPFYARAARANDLAVVEVPLGGRDLDRVSAKALVASRPKLVFVCRPNNPVGTAAAVEVVDAAAEALPGGLIVVDEAYVEFAAVASVVPLLTRHSNLVVTRTFSKAWGLAGARVGAVVAQPKILDTLRVIQHTYGVGSPAQALVRAALADTAGMRANVDRIVRERNALCEQISGLPVVRRVYPSQANFLLVELRDHSGVLAALRAATIAVADTSRDVPWTVRISVGLPEANRRLVEALRVAVGRRPSTR